MTQDRFFDILLILLSILSTHSISEVNLLQTIYLYFKTYYNWAIQFLQYLFENNIVVLYLPEARNAKILSKHFATSKTF